MSALPLPVSSPPTLLCPLTTLFLYLSALLTSAILYSLHTVLQFACTVTVSWHTVSLHPVLQLSLFFLVFPINCRVGVSLTHFLSTTQQTFNKRFSGQRCWSGRIRLSELSSDLSLSFSFCCFEDEDEPSTSHRMLTSIVALLHAAAFHGFCGTHLDIPTCDIKGLIPLPPLNTLAKWLYTQATFSILQSQPSKTVIRQHWHWGRNEEYNGFRDKYPHGREWSLWALLRYYSPG